MDITSGGHWAHWCGSEQACYARLAGVPQKKVGVRLRLRDDNADDRLVGSGALRKIWMEKKRDVISGVEAGHLGSLAVAELDQIVMIAALRLSAYRVWEEMPSAAFLDEISDDIGHLPAEPLSRIELAYVRARQKRERIQYGDESAARLMSGTTPSSGRA